MSALLGWTRMETFSALTNRMLAALLQLIQAQLKLTALTSPYNAAVF